MHRQNIKWADLEQQWARDEQEELGNTIALILAWAGLFLFALVLAFWPEFF